MLLHVEGLSVHFPIRQGFWRRQVGVARAVDEATFSIERGETLLIAGQEGAGKSALARTLLQLISPTSGQIFLEGKKVGRLKGKKLQQFRRQVQAIFSNPYASLNPRLRVGQIVEEPLHIQGLKRAGGRQSSPSLLKKVGLNPFVAQRYPFELSGLQRQLVSLARAMALQPDLLIMDEPLARLDRVVHSLFLERLRTLQEETGVAYLLLLDDTTEAGSLPHRRLWLEKGRLVEENVSAKKFGQKRH